MRSETVDALQLTRRVTVAIRLTGLGRFRARLLLTRALLWCLSHVAPFRVEVLPLDDPEEPDGDGLPLERAA
jgi:hypothetical protein